MKRLLHAIGAAVVSLTAFAMPARAAEQTVRLSVPAMDCPVCPITVKMALTKVGGVTNTEVSFEKREAIVTFDDTRTNVQALTEATKNAGYPSTPAKSAAQ